MPTFNWKELLSEWSRKLLESDSYTYYIAKLPSEVLTGKWLGYPGASEEQILRAEQRLGITLPPSYREFLKISNGWRKTTTFIDSLWPVEEIDWFSRRHQYDWIDPWIEGAGGIYPVSDEDYFVYGPGQDETSLRLEYLQTALEISPPGDAAIYLLNPKVISGDGEWEAWFFASWLPGANRYRSFYEMMQSEHERFLKLNKERAVGAANKGKTSSNSLTLIQRISGIFRRKSLK